ncbi:uncharacterized protein EAE97_003181 [Botrytis byssoidea]|uniref:Uncharacterized protein n=1 Tax=Botrytis byssoidea TaxID=139641 RepID=A0A9P5IPY2_9HELO|nr:uncharacterized protein EAE97_003181 [Botrytis byssoidea]KAF7949672.1 hypothetical protein EAE97_003181 [Botrytis byssoidea]
MQTTKLQTIPPNALRKVHSRVKFELEIYGERSRKRQTRQSRQPQIQRRVHESSYPSGHIESRHRVSRTHKKLGIGYRGSLSSQPFVPISWFLFSA